MDDAIKLKFQLKKEVHERLANHSEWLLCWISKSHLKSTEKHTTVLWFYPYEIYVAEINNKKKFNHDNFIPIHVSTNKLTEFLPGYVYTNEMSLNGYGLQGLNTPLELSIQNKYLSTPKYVQPLGKILEQTNLDWSQLPIPSSVTNTPCILVKKENSPLSVNFIIPCSVVAQKFFFISSRMVNLILNQDLSASYKTLSEPYIDENGERTIEILFEKRLSKAEELFIAFVNANQSAGKALQILSNSIIGKQEAYLFCTLPSLSMNLFVNYYLVNNNTAIVNQILDQDCDPGFDCLISSYTFQAKEEKNEEKQGVYKIPTSEIDTSDFELVIDDEANASPKNDMFFKISTISSQEYFTKREPTIKKEENIDLKSLAEGNRIGVPISVGQLLERMSTSPFIDSNSGAGRAVITTGQGNDLPPKRFYTLFVNAMSKLKGHGCIVEYFNNSNNGDCWQEKEILISLKFPGTTRNQVGVITRLSCKGQPGTFYFIETGNPLTIQNHYLGLIFTEKTYEINTTILKEIISEVAKNYGNWAAVIKTKILEENSITLRRFEHQDYDNEEISSLNAANKIVAYLKKTQGWTLTLIRESEE